MANIVLARIDERLIHGQIRLQWGKHSGANTILVANDEIAQMEPLQAPFKASAGSDFAVLFRTIDQTIANLPKAGMDRKILLLCKIQLILLVLSKVELNYLKLTLVICIFTKEELSLINILT
nr:PTS sugar transporter subunit IIB [Vibrio taketomensis]